MKAKLFNLIVGLLLILLLCSVQTSFGQLVTNTNTGNTYSTIQTAIDDPLTLNGHTLVVAPGVYTENVLVNKELTILGPKAGVDGNDGSRGSGEAILYPPTVWYGDGRFNGGYLMRVTADNVTIDGLTLNGDNPSLEGNYSANTGSFDIDFGIMCYWSGWYDVTDLSGDNLTIQNNVLKNFKLSAITLNSTASPLNDGDSKYGKILHNKIQNSAEWPAINLGLNYYANIDNNTIADVRSAIQIYWYWMPKSLSTTGTIKNNTFSLRTIVTNWGLTYSDVKGISYHFIYGFADPWTLSDNVLTNSSVGSTESSGIFIVIDATEDPMVISNNNISGFENGYRLSTNYFGTTITGGNLTNNRYGVTVSNFDFNGNYPADHSDFSISGMNIQNSTGAGVFVDDNATSQSHASVNANVYNCKINGGPVGILLNGSPCSATAHENDLSSNSSFAINNLSPNTVNATCNWYGHWTGPTTTANPGGMGTKVSSNVTFDPWVTNGTDNNLTTPGFQPKPGSCVPIKCGNKNKSYLFCHKGKTVCVGYDDALIHIGHGDAFGACPGSSYVNSAEKVTDETTILPFKVSNFPNPFSNSTRIQYQLPADCRVMLKVFDMTGKEVMVLVNSEKKAGLYSVDFNASALGSGIYYYKLTANSKEKEYVQTGKLVKQ